MDTQDLPAVAPVDPDLLPPAGFGAAPRPFEGPRRRRVSARRVLRLTAYATLPLLLLALIAIARDDYLTSTRAAADEHEIGVLRGNVADLDSTNATLNGRISALNAQVSALQTELKHPTLTIWTVPQSIDSSSEYLLGGVPDTFTYHLRGSAPQPFSVSILSDQQFIDAVTCTHVGRGDTHYCMTHSGGLVWADVTSVDYDFHDAEGCAAYFAVWTAASRTTIKPDVSVTYNPAPTGTGTCA